MTVLQHLHPISVFAQRAKSSVKSLLEANVEVDPTFEDLLDNFHRSRESMETAEDMFWKLRVENHALKEELRAVKAQLRDQNDTALCQPSQSFNV